MPKSPKPNALFESNKQKTLSAYKDANPTLSWDAIAKKIKEDGGLSSQADLKANADAWRGYKNSMVEADVDNGGGYSSVASGYADPKSSGQLVSLNASSPANAWWNGQVYKGGGESEILASTANSLIPYLASGEQQSIAKWVGENFSDFSAYKTASIANTNVSSETRNNFFSKERAAQAASALENMAKASGRSTADLGPGYAFLSKAIGLLDKYGGTVGNGMSRASYAKMQEEFNAMTAGADSSYVELGRAFLNPSSGGNPLMTSSISNGRTTSGAPNARLFT